VAIRSWITKLSISDINDLKPPGSKLANRTFDLPWVTLRPGGKQNPLSLV